MVNVRNEEGIITFEFDHGKVNSITLETLKRLNEVVQTANTDDSVRGIILTGAGRSFCGGFDLPMFLGFKTPEEVVDLFNQEEEFLVELFMCRKPVVSAINGHAVAGGLILAMASDYRIVKNHPKIRLGMSEIKLGLPLSIAESGIMRFGFDSDRKFRDMMYFGRMMNVEQALEFGIVDEIVEEADLIPRTRQIVSAWIDNPGRAFIKLKEGLKKPVADRIRRRLAEEDWQSGLKCFFDKEVREALQFVHSMM